MLNKLLNHLFKVLLITSLLVTTSCVPEQASKKSRAALNNGINSDGGSSGDGDCSGQNCAGRDDGSIGNIIEDLNENGDVELRHIIDPETGNYKTKVTIPKNYDGFLYLSGLNVTSLSDKFIKVRFKFGRDLEPITIPATIGRGEGITPQTDIEVIILNLSNKPFESVRLLYDLFDYNDYWDAGAGKETGVPVTDPRDGKLFCRGLKLEHDPTFEGSALNPDCDEAGEKCFYAYAKIRDRGLVDNTTQFSLIPSEPQIDVGGNGYNSESGSNQLLKCLPDNDDINNFNTVLNLVEPVTSLGIDTPIFEMTNTTTGEVVLNMDSTLAGYTTSDIYRYKGPFRTIDTTSWEITGAAVFSSVSGSNQSLGLFQNSYETDFENTIYGQTDAINPVVGKPDTGYRSFLFPRATQLDLSAGVEHVSSADTFDTRSLVVGGLVAPGDTDYMDGCNQRVQSYDDFSNESVSSCNVSATIEVIYEDDNGNEVVLNSSTQIKLQLIRSSIIDFSGREVLYSSLNTCTNSNACASDECCFNSRCWSKDIVSQCLEDVVGNGNKATGQQCATDYECASLCCNQSTSTCAVHLNTETEQVLCSKAPGQSCVAREWCRQENIPKCFKVKTGVTPQGVQLCAKRCYNVPTYGTCVDGQCRAPIPPVDNIDTSDCSDAIDPPTDLISL